jgi:hypothetical protein
VSVASLSGKRNPAIETSGTGSGTIAGDGGRIAAIAPATGNTLAANTPRAPIGNRRNAPG